jgi:hypothetical protein
VQGGRFLRRAREGDGQEVGGSREWVMPTSGIRRYDGAFRPLPSTCVHTAFIKYRPVVVKRFSVSAALSNMTIFGEDGRKENGVRQSRSPDVSHARRAQISSFRKGRRPHGKRCQIAFVSLLQLLIKVVIGHTNHRM